MESKCSSCRMTLSATNFKTKRNGILNKTCDHCINKATHYRNANKCPCGKQKAKCITHGGSAMCPCGKQKAKCITHGGSEMCPCGKQISQCKIHSDPIAVTIKTMIGGSKQKDKKYNRYDANNFIDRCFLEDLIENQTNCYWSDCNTPLQYITYTNNLATIERLDNSIGHIKSNCVLACKSCNCKVKSNH
jgi:hypothetical protein